MTRDIRNIAIIAHVDHGKTTLVDAMMMQSGAFRDNQRVAERAMDSGDLERERGITIMAKCTSVTWKNTRINIVDTPGHSDFGAEVERILGMVDSVILLIDAAEGPMPQTKFVTSKALDLGLRPIVVVNKLDRPDARPEEAHEECFDLFANLGANDEQLDFPILYASGRNGWAADDPAKMEGDLSPLFDLILKHVPKPKVGAAGAPFKMLVVTIESDPYLGRVLTGRVQSGAVKPNMPVKGLTRDGNTVERGRVSKILIFNDIKRNPVEKAEAGDIVAIAGLSKATVSDTLCDPAVEEPLAARPIDPPTLSVTFGINDSPFAGREGGKVQSRVILERLEREAESNVAIHVSPTEDADAFEVAGRGELQLGVLIETMRREGFELTIGRPRVLFKLENGQRLEPIEEVRVDVDEAYSGAVVESLSVRKGEIKEMKPSGGGKARLVFHVPTRGLIGYHGDFLTETRGTGVMSRLFHGHAPHRGPVPGRRNGVLISNARGKSAGYALAGLEERGVLFIGSGEDVYEGMMIGENAKPGDLEVNPLKSKQLTNFRASGKDDAIKLTPPRRLTLEQAISYIGDDECVEVTPGSVRLRKAVLDPHERKRAARTREAS